MPGRSEALLNATAAKYADALRRTGPPGDERGVGQLGVKFDLVKRNLVRADAKSGFHIVGDL